MILTYTGNAYLFPFSPELPALVFSSLLHFSKPDFCSWRQNYKIVNKDFFKKLLNYYQCLLRFQILNMNIVCTLIYISLNSVQQSRT